LWSRRESRQTDTVKTVNNIAYSRYTTYRREYAR